MEAKVGQCFRVFFDGGDFQRGCGKDRRNEQGLGGNLAAVERCFQLFVEDALVCGVHVDHDQSLRVLRQDVDTVELAEGVAERRTVGGDARARRIIRCRRVVVGRLGKGQISRCGRFGNAESALVTKCG